MSIDYASEKLSSAANTLATSPQSLQKRLFYAFMACQTLTNPSFHSNFPTPEIADRFMAWAKSVTHRPAKGDEGTVEATTSAMTDDEACKAAEELWSLYMEVEEAYIIRKHEREQEFERRRGA